MVSNGVRLRLTLYRTRNRLVLPNMTGAIRALGQAAIQMMHYLGQVARLLAEVVRSLRSSNFRYKQLGRQLVSIVTGAFTGAVFTAQVYFKFSELGLESAVGALVCVAMSRELGPVMTGLMVTGRVGAAMAAEIGTMKVTEQIDALRSMAVHPVDYLVTPRVVAILISMPLLIAESITFGMIASWTIAVTLFEIPGTFYWEHLHTYMALEDIGIGMIKGFVFGLLIVLVSCHQGLNARDGAVGVGEGTTSAVQISNLAILVFNFFLTFLLNMFWPLGSDY
jgi:phospholipid/cholesterol/gamma-HCH transport system permease protein